MSPSSEIYVETVDQIFCVLDVFTRFWYSRYNLEIKRNQGNRSKRMVGHLGRLSYTVIGNFTIYESNSLAYTPIHWNSQSCFSRLIKSLQKARTCSSL